MADRLMRARRAYEFARLKAAAPWSVPAALLGSLAWAQGAPSAAPVGLALVVAVVGLRWLGGDAARGARVGLVAGSLAFASLMAWSLAGVCGGPLCLASVVSSGAIALLALGPAMGGRSSEWVAAALATASLTAALPCLLVGAAGALVIPALWVGGLPLAALGRVRAP